MKDLAAKTLDGTVPTHAAIRKMPDAEIVERLTAVRGIGPWTVEMLLIFRHGAAGCVSGDGLRGAQGVSVDVSKSAEDAGDCGGGFAEAGSDVEAREEVGAVPERGELVFVAGMRSGEGDGAGGAVGEGVGARRMLAASE